MVYGSLYDNDVRIKSPEVILNLFDKITSYTHSGSKSWLPKKIEVMIWPYEYAPDASIIWPTDWPDINHPETFKRGQDLYSIFLDSMYFEDLKQFLKTRSQKGAVEINGKKWAVSFRFPFPHE